jgi:putative ATPase
MPTVSTPLAERMRPTTLADIVGQRHLIGPGKPFTRMVERGHLVSCILWGPPGSGKTTLARLVAEGAQAHLIQISAVSSGVKDVRAAIDQARSRRSSTGAVDTVLFVDEIHRFNKAQQDALLQAVEEGVVILIGATTENPSFEVIPPLRSRARTFTLSPLAIEDLDELLQRAIDGDPLISSFDITFDDRSALIAFSGGDARSLLNGFEMCCLLAEEDGKVFVTRSVMEEAFQRSFAMYDKGGEEHYNIISAFIKSVRGSDPDAALYWMARMINGGEDPLFIARRLVVLASEDIGNAEPNALLLANAGYQAVHAIGMPEARIVLSQVTTYLACAPKSNAAYLAVDAALSDVERHPPYGVPLHLRNAPTSFMKREGYGKGYKYPHDFPGHFIEQDYLPKELGEREYYRPTDIGREQSIGERLAAIRARRRTR